MTRSISPSMAIILEKLELERPVILTSEALTQLLHEVGIKTPARIVAARLRERGWLLPTSKRGAWEFIPASSAGAFTSNDPLLPIKSFLSKNNSLSFGLTFQTAAWMYGMADRVPARLEVASVNSHKNHLFPKEVIVSIFNPRLRCNEIKNVPVLAPESVIIHMAAKPRAVSSWQSTLEWLPDLVYTLDPELLLEEIFNRTNAVIARTGYLIQGMRPDIASLLYSKHKPNCKTWFGARKQLLRHDNKWLIADTTLPFDPRKVEPVI